MPRGLILLLLLLAVIAGLLWFLAGSAEEVPTHTIEVDVNASANAA